MGKLANLRHEAFAQYLSEGKSQGEAYALAYNRETDDYAYVSGSRLIRNDEVRVRVAELQERQQKQNDITVARITEMLLTAHSRSIEAEDISNERQAANDLAKLHGLIVDKSVVQQLRSLSELDESEIDALIASAEGREGAEDPSAPEPSQLH